MTAHLIGGIDAEHWVGRQVYVWTDRRRPVGARLISITRTGAIVQPFQHQGSIAVGIDRIKPWWAKNEDLKIKAARSAQPVEDFKKEIAAMEKPAGAANGNGEKVERNRLTNADFFKAGKWAETNRIALQKMALPEILVAISAGTGVTLTENNVASILEVANVTPKKTIKPAPLDALTEAVVRLYEKLGEPMPDAFFKAVSA